jgi:DNA helicase HerA-like ATPase
LDLSSVRIREHFGLISNDSHIDQFSFLVSPPKSRSGVEKNDYVLVDHPLAGEMCQILAVIRDISSYEEIAGSTINERKGKMLANAEILGSIDLRKEDKPLSKVLVPPNPGSRVYIPLKGFLEDILNRNVKGQAYGKPIEIGTFEGSSIKEQNSTDCIRCFIDVTEFTSKHTLICSVAGAGKTLTAKKLINAAQGSAQVVVFDPYDEYKDIDESLEVGKTDKEALVKDLRRGKIAVLSGHGLTRQEKQALYSDTLMTLLLLKSEEKVSPLFVVIEEADNLKAAVLEEAVSTGRKIGLSLCMITNNPSALGGRILSQTSNQIIGKTTDKQDFECLSNITGGTLSSAMLMVGEWILCGINRSMPIKVNIE